MTAVGSLTSTNSTPDFNALTKAWHSAKKKQISPNMIQFDNEMIVPDLSPKNPTSRVYVVSKERFAELQKAFEKMRDDEINSKARAEVDKSQKPKPSVSVQPTNTGGWFQNILFLIPPFMHIPNANRS